MNGLFIKHNIMDSCNKDNGYSLISQHKNTQIMVHKYLKNNKILLSPCKNKDSFEFFYIESGLLELIQDNSNIKLTSGDSFHTINLSSETLFSVLEDTKLIYFTTEESFHTISSDLDTLKRIIAEIDSKDQYTKSHCHRVGIYSITIAQHINQKINSIVDMSYASQLHDIGKCKIPDEILLKPGRFTAKERTIMEKHAELTYKILKEDFNLSDNICNIAACHHEKYDGSGYPKGLKGIEIPLESRIIAIADTFDAITTNRTYQEARSPYDALIEMSRFIHEFDPEIFSLFKTLVETKVIDPEKIPLEYQI